MAPKVRAPAQESTSLGPEVAEGQLVFVSNQARAREMGKEEGVRQGSAEWHGRSNEGERGNCLQTFHADSSFILPFSSLILASSGRCTVSTQIQVAL
jgi:hypothetical protein